MNNQGLMMEVIDYQNCHDIHVRFEDGEVITTTWTCFSNGYVRNPNFPYPNRLQKETIGETRVNHQGCVMKIIEYRNNRDVTVQFDDNPEQIVHTRYDTFKDGRTKNPFIPTLFGVGIVGVGHECNKEKEYITWHSMLYRCYPGNSKGKFPTYENCTVCDEFLHYPNFYNWIKGQENYEAWNNNSRFNLDKDIIRKGNKIYSPETCLLVPSRINCLILNNKNRRGEHLIGVSIDRSTEKYVALCNDIYLKKQVYLGEYNTEHEAFLAYKEYKEGLIKRAAEEEYKKGMISTRCKEALMNYVVEETD